MNPSRIVVVGASLAGLRAVETARREGFTGSLVLVGGEDFLPYDRPPLSKELIDGSGSTSVPYLPGVHDLSDRLSVDLRLGTWATAVVPDPANGSRMTSPARAPVSSTTRRSSRTGFSAGCPVAL